MSAVSLLKELIRFPSFSHEEKEVSDYVEAVSRSWGISTWRKENNVILSIGKGHDCLLLNSHLDVVPPSSGHPYDPFEPTEAGGRLYGRGSVDAKASGAAMLDTMRIMAASEIIPDDGRLILALTTCEENGRGYNGLEDVLPDLPEPAAAVIGEPTDLQVCTSQKGLLILRVEARGVSTHPARVGDADTAIEMASRDVARLSEFVFDHNHPELGHPTIAVTSIVGGSPDIRNVVPDSCLFMMDVRSTPLYSHDELVDQFRDLLESEVTIHSKRLVPCGTSRESRIVQAALRAAGRTEPVGSPTMSDWIFLGTIPAVKLGPGSSSLSHTATESIETAEVDRAVQVYSSLIAEYFNNKQVLT